MRVFGITGSFNSWWPLALVIFEIGIVSIQADLVTSQPPIVSVKSLMIGLETYSEIIWRYRAFLGRHRTCGCYF